MNMKRVKLIIKALEREHGELRPKDVVAFAKPEDSPLHGFFEWDDDVAAEQYRLGQARQLIGRIKIEVTVNEIPLNVVYYVKDPAAADRYTNILRVKSDTDKSRDVLFNEMKKVDQAARRARAVATILGTAEDVKKIIDLAQSVIDRIDIGDHPAGSA